MLISILCVICVNGWCSVINIPADYPSVQQGLNAAAEDDTVLVADGTYYENLKFPPINLTLASHFILDGDSSHISGTILDGSQPSNPDSASVILMNGGQDSSTCVLGFTLTAGKGTRNSVLYPGFDIHYGGGCALYQASPVIMFNHFVLDSACFGSGIYLGPGTDALLQNNEFNQNHSPGGNGAIYGDSCSAKIIGNEIHYNSAFAFAGLAFFHCDTVLIANNDVDHNTAVHTIAGVLVDGNYILTGNTISDHSTSDPWGAGGVGLSIAEANVTILNNQFLRNTNGFFYGALEITTGSSGIISANVFQDNASNMGAGLVLWGGSYSVSYNQFINNHDDQYGVVFIGLQAYVNMDHNTIIGSTNGTSRASGIITQMPIEIHDNNIFGNSPPAVAPDTLCPYAIDATNNWWGDPSGPYHPTLNPNGLGDTVGDNVLFDPWLTSYVGVQNISADNHPSEFRLYPAFPDPFNAATVLSFQLPVARHVGFEIYDVSGRRVARLMDGWRQAGRHEVTFDGTGLASGVYIYWLEAGEFEASGKMVLLK